MTTVDKIKQTTSPQQALLVLAQAIDELIERQPAADPWEQPLQWDAPGAEAHAEPAGAPVIDHDAIVRVQAQLAKATDPQEIEALSARIRLLEDPGQILAPVLSDGRRAVDDQAFTTSGNINGGSVTGGTVTLPAATAERQAARFAQAMRWQLSTFIPDAGLSPEDAAEAYSKGGPMWLYIGNRDAIMAMPVAWRAAMIDDIMEDSQTQAQEVARDILKSEDSVDRTIVEEAAGA